MMGPSSTYFPRSFSPKNAGLETRAGKAIEVARARLWMATIVFIFCLVAVFGRLVDLTLLRSGEDIDYLPKDQVFASGRADIVDKNGLLLATTLVTKSLYANAKKVQNPKAAAKKLVTLFPQLKENVVYTRLTSGKTFVWLIRHLTPKQQAKVLALGIPGIDFVRDYRRVYPQGNLVSHAVGFTDIDNKGVSGLEVTYDKRLRSDSAPLRLSIDTKVQHIVREELLKGIEEFGCSGASCCVMDIRTGELLALVSLPDFDPNAPTKAEEDALFNKVTLGIYELGSIMKVANTAMALESGKMHLGTRLDVSAPLRVGRFNITDYRANHGVINISEIFVYSSNKGSAKIALTLGAEHQKAFLKKIGLLDPPQIELPERGSPLVPKRWREDKVITISYGYGLSVSPFQAMGAIASMVRPWGKITPTLLAKDSSEPIQGERLVSEKTSRSLLHLMRFVVTHGTSRKADIPGYFVAGKTGTADLLINGRYNKERVAASFVGVFGPDITQPRYAMVLRLYDPQRLKKTFGFNTAGWNAAPVSGRVMERILTVEGILPKEEGKILEPFFQNVSFEKK